MKKAIRIDSSTSLCEVSRALSAVDRTLEQRVMMHAFGEGGDEQASSVTWMGADFRLSPDNGLRVEWMRTLTFAL
jgi:hypothetical protein